MNPKHRKVTGLSGNEIYCLHRLGAGPGQLCVGNSVVALGLGRGFGAGLATLGGGEVQGITEMVHDGRRASFDRMMKEAAQYGGLGVTGVTFDIIQHGTNLEFLTVGSTVHSKGETTAQRFSTSADAQELYCLIDAGFEPVHFVFGNVAYSIGLGGGIGGAFRQLARGEVPQYTEIFNHTRQLAHTRILAEAKRYGANAVVGIRTNIAPLYGAQEMMMVGTAAKHPALAEFSNNPVTSDMTAEEMWNMVSLGYLPLQLVMGVSVVSLGFSGGVFAALQGIGGGEVTGLTEILYEAREKALGRIEQEAERLGADEVVGVKTRVYDLGSGLVEFMAIGTAVKKFEGVKTRTENLIPQAIIKDVDTLVDATDGGGSVTTTDRTQAASARRVQGGPFGILVILLMAAFYLLSFLFRFR